MATLTAYQFDTKTPYYQMKILYSIFIPQINPKNKDRNCHFLANVLTYSFIIFKDYHVKHPTRPKSCSHHIPTGTPKVGIIMGSQSDWATMSLSAQILADFGIPFECQVVSAHRTPDKLFDYAKTAKDKGLKVIIAGQAERLICLVCVPAKPHCLCLAYPSNQAHCQAGTVYYPSYKCPKAWRSVRLPLEMLVRSMLDCWQYRYLPSMMMPLPQNWMNFAKNRPRQC